jgi:hypothetical protein
MRAMRQAIASPNPRFGQFFIHFFSGDAIFGTPVRKMTAAKQNVSNLATARSVIFV